MRQCSRSRARRMRPERYSAVALARPAPHRGDRHGRARHSAAHRRGVPEPCHRERKAGVAGIYNRAAYGPEKKAALERWAAHVAGLVSGQAATVTPLRRKGRE